MGAKATPIRFEGAVPRPRPGPGSFEVFMADVTTLAGQCDTTVLSKAETKKAKAFARQEDQNRYEVAHVMLRQLLSSYLDTHPATLPLYTEACPLCAGPHGRPAVKSEPQLHFSLSHGGDYAMAAFAATPIGVDVEPIPASEVLPDLLGTLDDTEQHGLKNVPERARPAAFARAWVRKEAHLKALGTGLALNPATIHAGIGETPIPGTVDLDLPMTHAAAVHLLPPSKPQK